MRAVTFVMFFLMLIFGDSVQSWAEPPVLDSASNVDLYPVGQILKYQRSLWITTVSIRHQHISDGISRLTPAQTVIYNRIRHREPTHPDQYQIPPVRYRVWDQLLRKAVRGAGWTLVGIVGFHGTILEIDALEMGRRVVIHPIERDVLLRGTVFHEVRRVWEYDHFATYWRGMWLVRALLPRNQEEEEQEH